VISLVLLCPGVLTVLISVYAKMVACAIHLMVLVTVLKVGQVMCVIKRVLQRLMVVTVH
jgi:hypothetical protein